MDGGAVVNYYNLLRQNYLRPEDQYWGVSKVPEELKPNELPFVNFPVVNNSIEEIPKLMQHHQIPLLNTFHLGPEDFDKVVGPVHDVGGKMVLHQTIHWLDDTVFLSKTLPDIDCIVAPTNYAKTAFIHIGKLPHDQIEIIPHGVDTEKFKKRKSPIREQLGIREDQKVILYSGRLSFWKGVQELIPIMRKLYQRYDCVFIIRGGAFWGNDESRRLYKIFERLGWNNPNIIFISEWQSPAYMEELHSIADIVYFNSGHEGFGVPLIEAMSCESIPITTALANHVEICGNTGEAALLLDPTKQVGEVNNGTAIKIADNNAIFSALEWILENPEEAEVMGKNGRERVLQKYDLDIVCKQWLELYDRLIPEDYSMDEAMVDE